MTSVIVITYAKALSIKSYKRQLLPDREEKTKIFRPARSLLYTIPTEQIGRDPHHGNLERPTRESPWRLIRAGSFRSVS